MDSIRDDLLEWIDQYEKDHYVFDAYGETISVDLPREAVEKVMDIAICLVDRVVEAQGDLNIIHMADYCINQLMKIRPNHKKIRRRICNISSWL